jgi:hypothetical protein
MAVKLFVNDVAETLGVVVVLVDEGELVVVVVVDDELPHAVTPNTAVTASAVRTALLFSKFTMTSLSFINSDTPRFGGLGRCDCATSLELAA